MVFTTLQPHKNRPFHILAIILLTGLVYANSLSVPFQFDDYEYIVDNPIVKDWGFFVEPAKARALSRHFPDDLYWSLKMRYVAYLTFASNYALHGTSVFGYHFANISIHAINAILLYQLIFLSFRTPFLRESPLRVRAPLIAFSGALLFACHPLQTQAVTYIWQRVTSLATLFFLLSVVLYIRWRLTTQEGDNREGKPGRRGNIFDRMPLFWYICSLLSALVAMKTKEISFTLPPCIVLCEVLFFDGRLRKRLLPLIPFLLTMMIIPLSLLKIDRAAGDLMGDVNEATRLLSDMSRWDYLLTEFTVVVTYIRLILFPMNQSVDYDYPVRTSLMDPRVFGSFLFLLSLFCFGVYLLWRSRTRDHALRLAAFGIFWFFLTLSVESSIIPIVDRIFEHRVYLPSAGIFVAIPLALFWAGERLKTTWRSGERVIASGLSAIILAFAVTAHARNIVWQDDIRLWVDVISKNPNKARAYHLLGLGYFNRNEMERAIEMYTKATSLNPPYSPSYYNLGFVYLMRGMAEQGHFNLGMYYFSEGQYERAVEHYTKALDLNPDNAETYNNRAVAYAAMGQRDLAIEDWDRALRMNPGLAGIPYNLGLAYAEAGEFRKAIERFSDVIAADPGQGEAYLQRGYAYIAIGDREHAEKDFQKSCEMGNRKACNALQSTVRRP